jgi:hypothetical protein
MPCTLHPAPWTWSIQMDDFFIGYNWPQPPGLLRLVKRAALGLGVGVVGLSGALAMGHVPLEGGLFEFGQVRTVTGTVVERPHPMLRPDDDRSPWPLLVSKGKHGAGDAVRGLEGRRVHLQATRIARGAQTMLEIDVEPAPAAGASDPAPVGDQPADTSDEHVTLRGEIVDSKCFLGVMVPGAGTTHRDCASLCLRGGIPPALFVREAEGTSSLVLLTGAEPSLRDGAAARARGPVEMSGPIEQRGGGGGLRTDPNGWRALRPR